MATLVLTAVGTIVGGPIGGAIGAMIGQRADQALFAPKPTEGPRLGELAVQTSSYGSVIPKLFGTMRVSGTVIWSTDLREERSSGGGGKGQPKTVNYSYSASFAVALSGRRIRAIKRIWADGKLLRGAANDFKARTRFRFYDGSEDQVVDPLIASVEGAGQAPAFRGIAYALFEDLALEDFGNRMPSLSFEVEADAGAVAIGDIAAELSVGGLRGGSTPEVLGYAASGDSVRGAIEALSNAVPLSVAEDEAGGTIRSGASVPLPLDRSDQVGREEISRRGAGKLPRDVTITYYEAARDYQAGLQRAFRSGGGQRSERRELPAVLTAGAAKGFAEARLASLWSGAARAKLELSWRGTSLRPGMHVSLHSSPGLWRIERWVLGAGRVALELVRVPSSSVEQPAHATPGRSVEQRDLLHGPSLVRVYDLPLGEEARMQPLLFVLAAGEEAGWRGAELVASYDDGASWQAVGATAAPAVMGSTAEALQAGSAALIDATSALEVELLNESMWLESCTDDALVSGANLAIVGSELVQFGKVEALGERRFRLTRLLRGRRGTEWATAAHQPIEDFALVDPMTILPLLPPAGSLGGHVRVMASGIGDDLDPAEAQTEIVGAALQPPSPVHLDVEPDSDGGLHIRWVRRSRLGWAWASAEVPLGEESETYRLTLRGPGFQRSLITAVPAYTYTAAERAADGQAGPLDISVVQIGTLAASTPAQLRFGGNA